MKRHFLTRPAVLGVAGLATAFLLTGCGDDDKKGGAWADGTPSAAAPAGPAGDGTATDAEAAADPDRCRGDELAVSLGTLGTTGGEDAVQKVNLVFTNKGTRECTITGYPKVAWVTGEKGIQINESFEQDTDVAKQKVSLAAGKVGHAVLLMHSADEYDDDTCKPRPIAGLRVQAPGETAPSFIGTAQTVCSVAGVNIAQVQPVVAGA